MKKIITIKKEELDFDILKISGINRVDIVDKNGIKLKIEVEVGE